MKFVFVVQGEGRGHMTQALALKELIEESNHEVSMVLVGIDNREIPPFFLEAFETVIPFKSPSFSIGNGKKVDTFATAKRFLSNLDVYYHSINWLSWQINQENPDVVINFYEPLYGLSRAFGRITKVKRSIVIGHQYMFFNKGYFLNKKYPLYKTLSKIWCKIVGYDSEKVALSFYPCSNFKDVTVLPPLLRKCLFEIKPINDGSILVYSVNNGYAKDLIGQSFNRKVNCFCEKFWENDGQFGNIKFHELDGKKFLEYMGKCDTLFCTAGFESLCEAAYLGKQIVATPLQNHFEQYYNALDASRRRLVTYRKTFEIKEITHQTYDNSWFKAWVDSHKDEYKRFLGL
jgi:uncharacterized protein (TIGR00661 family)